MVEKKAETIDLKADSNKLFFLIHGYSGSPTDFNKLPYHLHKKFNANVKVICLKGHGTKVQDLDYLTYNDFLNQIETELKKEIKNGREIILGGVSLGALYALLLTPKYPIKLVFNICPPYLLNFPFNIKYIETICSFKKYWLKHRDKNEKNKRKDAFSYDYMHINGLKIVKQASKKLDKTLKEIDCPILSIHSYTDPIGHYKSSDLIQNKVKSKINEKKILNTKVHNVFFSMNNNETYKRIINFVEKNMSDQK